MDSMPPVKLGAILLVPLAIARIVRTQLERRLVLSAPMVDQANRQFMTDFLLYLTVGFVAMVFNRTAYGFPFFSGVKIIIGCIVTGFFASLDMMLHREGSGLQGVPASSAGEIPSERFHSLTRRFSLVAVTTAIFVTVIVSLVISSDISWIAQAEGDAVVATEALRSVMIEISFIAGVLLAMVMNLIVSYSRNLKLLFENETGVLEKVSRGDLTSKVPVVTGDEFGIIAGHTNTMIDGLRHRSRLMTALKLAEEVQQNLLPQKPPSHPDIAVAGTSIYCYETGGDYYDYFTIDERRLGVVVADVSDHGVGAALLMASSRAHIRSSFHNYEGPRQLVEQVNRNLSMETADTGRFATLFFLEIDTSDQILRWVRAGHEPALFYDAEADRFTRLDGRGLALGIDKETSYQAFSRQGWSPGTIILVGTDGIHEARNENDDPFGMDRVKTIIAGNATESPDIIQKRIIDDIEAFRGDAPQEDDITLVVVKLV